MKTQKRYAAAICTLIALLCLLGSCATHQTRNEKKYGFLGDYSMLKEGGKDRALLVYIDPEADIQFYTRILMDPVKCYASREHGMQSVSPEDLEKILNYTDAAIREQLEKDYVFVREPGLSAMRLRVAITEAEHADVALDIVSTVVPIEFARNSLQALAKGSYSFIGSAGFEVELLDSRTDKRLMAIVDRQGGGTMTGTSDKFYEWPTVKQTIDCWAERLQKRLTALQGRSNTTPM